MSSEHRVGGKGKEKTSKKCQLSAGVRGLIFYYMAQTNFYSKVIYT